MGEGRNLIERALRGFDYAEFGVDQLHQLSIKACADTACEFQFTMVKDAGQESPEVIAPALGTAAKNKVLLVIDLDPLAAARW